MTARKKRIARATNARMLLSRFAPDTRSTCVNCGELGPHFVPPCFGEAGYFMCQPSPPGGKVAVEMSEDEQTFYAGFKPLRAT